MSHITVLVGISRTIIKGPQLTVTGKISADFFNTNVDRHIPINKNNTTITVTIGDLVLSGDDVLLYPGNWSCTVEALPAGDYNINVAAEVVTDGKTGIGTDETSVQIVDNIAPALSIDAPHVIIGTGPTYSANISGSAEDDFGVDSVQYKLDRRDQEWLSAYNESGDWRKWEVKTELYGTGNHLFLIRATDNSGNISTASVIIETRNINLSNTYPVALFPVRLETRFEDEDLLVRIYPDQISLDSHDTRLTEAEYEDGKLFLQASDQAVENEQRRAAWRKLAELHGPERAAWIAKTVSSKAKEDLEFKQSDEEWFVPPKLVGMPDKFVVFAYPKVGGDLIVAEGNPVSSHLKLVFTSNDVEPIDEESKWTEDFEKAIDVGMAVRVPVGRISSFSRVIVIGLRTAEGVQGHMELAEILNAHRYSTGMSFPPHGVATNNTGGERSGYSEILEDVEGTFDAEFAAVEDSNHITRISNAERLSWALGLQESLDTLNHAIGGRRTFEPGAQDLRLAFWPATGNYFLRNMFGDLSSNENLPEIIRIIANHFVEHVWGAGSLPTIRIGDQPYGILPVSTVRAKNNGRQIGWKTSKLDALGDDAWPSANDYLYQIVSTLFEDWLKLANDVRRVPRVNTTDDPDEEIVRVLSMEPVSISFGVRSFIGEALIAWLLVALRTGIFGEGTSYFDEGHKLYYWIHRWAETRRQQLQASAESWQTLVPTTAQQLMETQILHALGWINSVDLSERPILREPVSDPPEEIGRYLQDLCALVQPTLIGLLEDVLRFSSFLADSSCFTQQQVADAIANLVYSNLLAFLNSVSDAQQIVSHVIDYVSAGNDANGTNEMLHTAEAILQWREQQSDQKFTSIEQLDHTPGIDVDTTREIVNMLLKVESNPNLDRLIREIFDLFTHRLDAWITSLATRRLAAMRINYPEDVYIGAYGFVEDLEREQIAPGPCYIHSPSYAQTATAAVLYNAYLTHKQRKAFSPFWINLNSDRVRRGLRILKGMRQGQPLGALLGYQFERALHENRLDRYIDDFRAAFPLVATKEDLQTPESESVEALAARNVVDGLAMALWYEDKNRQDIAPGDYQKREELRHLLRRGSEGSHNPRTHLKRLRSTLDSTSDLLTVEAVYQSIQGNFERGGAALEAAAGNAYPPEIESMASPMFGKMVGHRVCVIFPPAPSGAHENDCEPRQCAEPRISAWMDQLLGDLHNIHCQFAFRSQRVNVNEAAVEDLERVPGLNHETAESIDAFRQKQGPFHAISELELVPGIDASTITTAQRWLMTGFEEEEALHYYERLDINQTTITELMVGLAWTEEQANQLIGSRPVQFISQLETILELSPEEVDLYRPWITCGRESVTVANLEVTAVDMLYLSNASPEGGETEIERRIKYWVRREFGLKHDAPVGISYSREGKGAYTIREALILCRQIVRLFGISSTLKPAAMASRAASDLSFTTADADELEERLGTVSEQAFEIIAALGGKVIRDEQDRRICVDEVETVDEATIIDALFEASHYGIATAIPRGPDDPELYARQKQTLIELCRRVQTCADLLSGNNAQVPDRRVEVLTDCFQALLGNDFVVLPTLTPAANENLQKAFDQMATLKDEDIQLWLEQAALVHPPLRELGDTMLMTNAWKVEQAATASSELRVSVAQLPYREGNSWLALDDAKRGPDLNKNHDRGAVSIVTAFAGSPGKIDKATTLAGLLLEEWDEFIPGDKAHTSVGFQYDGPNSQAPQCILLAVPSEWGGSWSTPELAQIVYDTMDLMKVRAVDLDAMRELEDSEPDVLERQLGQMLPALMFPWKIDPEEEPSQGLNKTIEDWLAVLMPRHTVAFDRELIAEREPVGSDRINTYAEVDGKTVLLARISSLAATAEYQRTTRFTGDNAEEKSVALLPSDSEIIGELFIELAASALSAQVRVAWPFKDVRDVEDMRDHVVVHALDEEMQPLLAEVDYRSVWKTSLFVEPVQAKVPLFEIHVKAGGLKALHVQLRGNKPVIDSITFSSGLLEET